MDAHGNEGPMCSTAFRCCIDLPTALDDRSMASSLRRLATALVAWLSDEIDEHALFAASDECLGENSRVVLY
jgi:hypothetical protein